MDSYIADVSVLSKALGTFDRKHLMGWGVPGFTTTEVDISHLKRVFYMETVCERRSSTQELHFGVGQEVGAVLKFNMRLRPGDRFKVKYTITGTQGDGPNSVVVKSPSGKALRINIYASAG
jgi:hypothetical protein